MRNRPLYFLKLLFELALSFQIGCASPAKHFDAVAEELGLLHQSVESPVFSHQIYINQIAELSGGDALHIYLDGDGSPWNHQSQSAEDDPTSRNPMILQMLSKDKKPAILLGRPCYHNVSQSSGCNPSLWTHQRYSAKVVDSMRFALEQWLNTHPYQHLVFIGFSGGGVLAALLAPLFCNTKALLTIAANLDTDAWSKWHQQPLLEDSLNPARQSPLASRIQQIHLVGSKDRIVPIEVIRNFISKQTNHLVINYPEQNHHCCWDEIWPTPLDLLRPDWQYR